MWVVGKAAAMAVSMGKRWAAAMAVAMAGVTVDSWGGKWAVGG